MDWGTAAGLLLQYGVPFTEYVIGKVQKGGEVTPEEWAEVKALANVSAKQEMQSRLKAAGIAEDSEQGKALLALVG